MNFTEDQAMLEGNVFTTGFFFKLCERAHFLFSVLLVPFSSFQFLFVLTRFY